MSAQKVDKRRMLRVEVKEAKVQFKPTGGLFAFLKGASEEMPVVNVSLRGLRFISKEILPMDKKLSFTIGIPMLGAEPLTADGQVVWVERSLRYNGYAIGVRFTAMTQESISRLKNLISFLGSRVKIKQKVKVTFSEEMKREPIIWQLARDFDVTVNVIQGLLTEKTNWLVLEIEGEQEEIRRVLEYLKQKGAVLAFPKKV